MDCNDIAKHCGHDSHMQRCYALGRQPAGIRPDCRTALVHGSQRRPVLVLLATGAYPHVQTYALGSPDRGCCQLQLDPEACAIWQATICNVGIAAGSAASQQQDGAGQADAADLLPTCLPKTRKRCAALELMIPFAGNEKVLAT